MHGPNSLRNEAACSDAEEDTEDRRVRKEEKDENPFSFKKFLRTSNRSSRHDGAHNGPNSLTTLDLANDLPDFVQDYYGSGGGCGTGSSDSPRVRQRNPATEAAPLPDFAIDSANSVNLPAAPVDGQCGNECHRLDNHAVPAANVNFDLPAFIGGGDGGGGGGSGHLEQPLRDVNPEDSGLPHEASGARPRSNFNAHGPPSLLPESSLPGLVPDVQSNAQRQPEASEDLDEEEPLSLPPPQSVGTSRGLPDFLPDSAIGGAGARPKVSQNGSVAENGLGLLGGIPDLDLSGRSRDDLSHEIRRIQRENQELRRQLAEAQEAASQQSTRIATIKQERDNLQRRESEETAVLENMVQQVESNLLTSTKRATKAENTIVKLREEVQSLQSQVQSLSLENDALREGTRSPREDLVREKARYASEQLASAAKNAEHTIKQLLAGVDTLKVVSDVLASIDKVSDFDGCYGHSPSSEEPRGAEGGP